MDHPIYHIFLTVSLLCIKHTFEMILWCHLFAPRECIRAISLSTLTSFRLSIWNFLFHNPFFCYCVKCQSLFSLAKKKKQRERGCGIFYDALWHNKHIKVLLSIKIPQKCRHLSQFKLNKFFRILSFVFFPVAFTTTTTSTNIFVSIVPTTDSIYLHVITIIM